MGNFGALYRFELKKLLQRKMLWLALAILTAVAVFLPATEVMGNYYVSGGATGEETLVYTHYAFDQYIRTDPAGLDGRPLDNALIREAFLRLGLFQAETVSDAEDDEQAAFPVIRVPDGTTDWTMESTAMRRQYWDVEQLVEGVANGNAELMERYFRTGVDFYDALDQVRTQKYVSLGLTEDEIAWWDARSQQLETPFIWRGFSEGWQTAVQTVYTVNILVMLFAIVALSGLFPMERQRRTQAQILCARNGKTPLYAAKFLAGLTVNFAGAAVMLGGMLASCLALIGPEGFDATVQQTLQVYYGAPLFIGQLALIACGLCLAASLVHAAFVMTVSLGAKSGTAAMAVSFGVMLLFIMVPVMPSRWYELGLAWSVLPGILGASGYLDPRLVHLGGYLTNYQAAPLLWLALTLALAALAWALHRRVPRR